MKHALLIVALLISPFVFSQKEEVKNYEWDLNPKFKEIPAEFKDYPAVVLKDYRLYDNRVGQYTYKAFVVMHSAIKILTDNGVNDYNKVNINKKYVRDYRDLKARVIKPDGKIEELPKEKIIEKDDSDEKQFVFEGVEKGDIIEYYYVIKDFPDFSGVEYFQRTIPVLDAKFQVNGTVSSAKTYVFGYNGMKDESVKKTRVFTASNLPAYKEEVSAANSAYIAKVYFYTVSDNYYNYQSYYRELNAYADGVNAKSMIKKFVAQLGLNDASVPLDERLKKMDIYLKENIEVVNGNEFYVYKKIFDEKKITPRMTLYLYKDVLDYIKVPYQFLASTDKFENHLDKDNVVPAALSEILIYIPETKKYLSPFYYWMPYGPPTSVCVNNDAAYFQVNKAVTVSFTKIDGVSMEDNIVKTNSEITLDDDMEKVMVNKKMEITGYRSSYYRSYMKYIPEDKTNEFVKSMVFNDIDVDLKKFTFSNKEYKYNYDNEKPFTFETEVQVKESWIENAGKNYLISLGKVLGKQTDLYQETTRKHPIDLSYPNKYIHNITFKIPNGYTVKNLNALLLNKELKNEKNEVIGSFSSTAVVEDNTVKIAVVEFYNFTHLAVEKYNEYRDLINASYDFYKASLVLTK